MIYILAFWILPAVRNTSTKCFSYSLSFPDVNKAKCRPLIIQKLTVVIVVTVNFVTIYDAALCIVIHVKEGMLSLSSWFFYLKRARSVQKPALVYSTKLPYIPRDVKLQLNCVNLCSNRIMILLNLKIRGDLLVHCPTVLIGFCEVPPNPSADCSSWYIVILLCNVMQLKK